MKNQSMIVQLLCKYNHQTEGKKNEKVTKLKKEPETKTKTSPKQQTRNQDIISIRNKNLEQLLKKLNTKQNYFDNFSVSSNHLISNSFANNSYHSTVNNNNGIMLPSPNQSFYSAKNADEDNANILSILKRTQRNKQDEKLFTKTADTLVVTPLNQPLLHNSLTNNNQDTQNEILRTSKETSTVVNKVDFKVKEIKLKMLRDTHIDIEKLSKYNNTLKKLYSFLTSFEINSIYTSCKFSHNNLRKFLKKGVDDHIVKQFSSVYGNKLKVEGIKTVYNTTEKGNLNVTLILKARVILPSKFEDYTIEIENKNSLLNSTTAKQYRNKYRFDYKYHTGSSQIWWVIKEKTYFNYDTPNKAYCMPIVPFKYNDTLEISVTLLSSFGLIDFETFSWSPLRAKKFENLNYINYNNSVIKRVKDKQLCDYDLSRFCEMELIKTKWCNYEKLKEKEVRNEITNFLNLLTGFFFLEKIEFEDVGFYIIKIHTRAVYAGTIEEKDLGIRIQIKNIGESVLNEVRKNGLICEIGSGFEIRVNDEVVFYLTLSKTE